MHCKTPAERVNISNCIFQDSKVHVSLIHSWHSSHYVSCIQLDLSKVLTINDHGIYLHSVYILTIFDLSIQNSFNLMMSGLRIHVVHKVIVANITFWNNTYYSAILNFIMIKDVEIKGHCSFKKNTVFHGELRNYSQRSQKFCSQE